MSDRTILVTGAAGVIGFHLSQKLLQAGHRVVGVDSINDYYDPKLKEARLDVLKNDPSFSFIKLDLADRTITADLFKTHRFPVVIHLAAQAGVRYSSKIRTPMWMPIFRASSISLKAAGITTASTCCSVVVVGLWLNTKLPFSVHDSVDHPVSLYAASKKANELMAHPTAIFIAFRRRACGSSRSTGHGAGRTWRCFCSPRRSLKESRSRCSTTATCVAISRMSTT